MVKDPYEVLGVRPGADMDEIKRAYRAKAKQYHPDLHPDDPRATERMQQINQAYDMLRDPGKYRSQQRSRPDGYRTQARPNTGGYADPGWQARNSGWQYSWTTGTNGQDRAYWQSDSGWQDRQRRSANVASPLRVVLRLVSGLLLLRFFLSLLRFGFWGFFL